MAYDADYAHEYYLKHRELKGRKKSTSTETSTSTSTSTTTKKESTTGKGLTTAQKSELKEYWTSLKADLATEKENINEAKTETINAMNEKLGSQIDALKEFISNSSDKEQKALARAKIAELRQTKKDTRAKIVEQASSMYSEAKESTYKKYNSKLNSMAKK
jgi:hypothetical protein